MTVHTQFLRVARLKGQNKIEIVARHNLREIKAERGFYGAIDGRSVERNEVVRGANTAREVGQNARALLASAGITKPRKDAVMGIELVISLRPRSEVEQQAFFADALSWVEDYFKVPIVSAVIHRDESAPHLQLILIPLIDGRLRGSDLVSSKYKLIALHVNFHEAVGRRYGLVYVPPGKRKRARSSPIGFEGVSDDDSKGFVSSCEQTLCSVRVPKRPPLTTRQRTDLLTWQFTVGIQQKLGRGAHRWSR